MRVITGIAKGRKLKTLEGMDVRPTTDGVKEAIFSTIQFEIEGRMVLDLFAGSGQLGIEAISRGAKKAVFVDSSIASINVVKDNIKTVGFEDKSLVVNMPNSAFLRSTKETFDIALLDPPYEHKLIQKSLPALVEKMSEQGVIVCEHESKCALPEQVGDFVIARQKKHGRTALTIYRNINAIKADEEDEEE